MAFSITGKIEVIGETNSIATKNGSTIYRRDFVLDATRFNPETGEPWENHPKFELSGNNVNILNQFQVGQKVTVDFSLRGAKYQDKQTGEMKYFTSVSAFRITPFDSLQNGQAQYQVEELSTPSACLYNTVKSNGDDLPF